MKISEINFDAMEAVRKKCITFAKDGNTVVKPYKTLYNVEKITHNESHCNLFFEVVKSKREWEENSFCLWEDLGNICTKIDWIPRYWTLEEFSEKFHKLGYFGIDGFYKRLKDTENEGGYINKVDIEICTIFEKIELAKHYAEYREKFIRKQEAETQAKREEYERQQAEKRKAQQDEIKKAIDDAENKIFRQQNFDNIEVDGKSVINKLMERYGINVPPRTQGWINSKLVMIVFDGGKISYRFYGKSQRDNSKVFIDYLEKLENAINKKLAFPFC